MVSDPCLLCQVNAAIDDMVAYAEANRDLCAAVRNNSSKPAPAERKRGHALLTQVAVGPFTQSPAQSQIMYRIGGAPVISHACMWMSGLVLCALETSIGCLMGLSCRLLEVTPCLLSKCFFRICCDPGENANGDILSSLSSGKECCSCKRLLSPCIETRAETRIVCTSTCPSKACVTA